MAKQTNSAALRTLKDFPAFVQAEEKLQRLRIERDAVERQVNEALTALAEGGKESATEAAQRFLDGVPGAGQPLASTREKLNELVGRRRIITRAIELQGAEVERCRHEVAPQICGERRPEYSAIIRDLAVHLIAGAEAAAREAEIREWFHLEEIPFVAHMPPVPCWAFKTIAGDRGAASFFDPQGRLMRWLGELLEHGYIDASELESLGLRADAAAILRRCMAPKPAKGIVQRVTRGVAALASAAADAWTTG